MTYFIIQTPESDLHRHFCSRGAGTHNKESHWTLCLQYRQVTLLAQTKAPLQREEENLFSKEAGAKKGMVFHKK